MIGVDLGVDFLPATAAASVAAHTHVLLHPALRHFHLAALAAQLLLPTEVLDVLPPAAAGDELVAAGAEQLAELVAQAAVQGEGGTAGEVRGAAGALVGAAAVVGRGEVASAGWAVV
jgi:hypothetical protein